MADHDVVARDEHDVAVRVDDGFDELEGTLDAIRAGIPPEEVYMLDLAHQAEEDAAALRAMFQEWMDAVRAGVAALADERNEAVAELAQIAALYEKDTEGVLMVQEVLLEAVLAGMDAPNMGAEFRAIFVETVQAIVRETNQRVLEMIRDDS